MSKKPQSFDRNLKSSELAIMGIIGMVIGITFESVVLILFFAVPLVFAVTTIINERRVAKNPRLKVKANVISNRFMVYLLLSITIISGALLGPLSPIILVPVFLTIFVATALFHIFNRTESIIMLTLRVAAIFIALLTFQVFTSGGNPAGDFSNIGLGFEAILKSTLLLCFIGVLIPEAIYSTKSKYKPKK